MPICEAVLWIAICEGWVHYVLFPLSGRKKWDSSLKLKKGIRCALDTDQTQMKMAVEQL